MTFIGRTLFFFGVLSVALYFLELEFAATAWIGNWGTTIAWLIRAGFIVVGALVWKLGNQTGVATTWKE